MGIGNDIKPKKIYRFDNQPKKKDYSKEVTINHEKEPVKEESSEIVDSKHEQSELSQLKDDFFDDIYHNKKIFQEQTTKKQHHGKLPKTILWILLGLLTFLVVYQNLSDIKAFLLKENNRQASIIKESDEYYTGSDTTNDKAITVTPSPSVAVAPSPTPTIPPSATTSIEVLNGNGINGAADAITNQLVNAGYTVSKTANAKSFSYQKTYIYYAADKEAEATAIKNILTSKEIEIEQSEALTKTYNIIVVVGKK